jgi:hypothetical protein
MTLADVIAWLERKEREIFADGIYTEDDMGIVYSVNEAEAAEFEAAAEALRELRQMICGEEGE